MAQIGLLEDNARIAKMCTTLLHLTGHHVTVYEHPRKCLQALLFNEMGKANDVDEVGDGMKDRNSASFDQAGSSYMLPVDVLILDLTLPDINGVEVVWQLQSHHQTQRLPLILCTAAPTSEVARALRIAPQAALVMKPFKLETLISAISAALSAVSQ